MWLKNKKINQILYINEIEEASKVKKEMQSGKRKVMCDLEYEMLKDIRIFYEMNRSSTGEFSNLKKKKKKEILDRYRLEDMP